MIPNKNRQEIEIFDIPTSDGIKPNACVFLPETCFGISGGSYLLIDTDSQYLNDKLCVFECGGNIRLVKVLLEENEFILCFDNEKLSLSLGEFSFLLEGNLNFIGVVLQAVIDVNAEFSSERFHAALHSETET